MKTFKELDAEQARLVARDIELEKLLKISNGVLTGIMLSIVGWWGYLAVSLVRSFL